MNLTIRKWKIDDKSDLAVNLNNPKVMDNFRDGLPYEGTLRSNAVKCGDVVDMKIYALIRE